MKSGDFKMTVETLQSGQADSYKPTVYEYRVFFQWLPYSTKATKVWEPQPIGNNEDYVRRFLFAVHPWVEEGEGDWASERLVRMEKVGPSTWEFRVEAPFTD